MMKRNLRLAVCVVGSVAVAALASAQTVAGRNSNGGTASAPLLGSPVPPPATFGTTQYSVTSVFAGAFTGHDALDPIATNPNYYRYFTGGSKAFLGSISIPEGVIIDYVGLNNCDAPGGDFTITLYDSVGVGVTTIGSLTSNAHDNCLVDYNSTPGHEFGYSYPMNAGHNLEIEISQNGGAPTDGSVGVQSVELWWRRLVSPAPAMADFTDVPTSSPQYQYIEALFQAGITAGCGGGNYCPNNPVTRGQMAVFLTKALGLNWPETPVP
jgi:S-layer homology domain